MTATATQTQTPTAKALALQARREREQKGNFAWVESRDRLTLPVRQVMRRANANAVEAGNRATYDALMSGLPRVTDTTVEDVRVAVLTALDDWCSLATIDGRDLVDTEGRYMSDLTNYKS